MSLWLPIIVSGVALFFASWAAWMLLPHHKPRVERPARRRRRAGMHCAATNVPPGQYMFPVLPASRKTGRAKSSSAAREAGPTGTLTVWKKPPNMGVNMLCTLLFFTIANFVIAYLAGMVLPARRPIS